MTDCEVRKQIVEKYGEEAGCGTPNIPWAGCVGSCFYGSECPECGDERVSCYGPCHGRHEFCMNPECVMDK